MRLFIAVLLTENQKNEISGCAEKLRKECLQGNFSGPENYHLTLEFLGELPESRIPAIRRAMDCCSVEPFSIHIGKIGFFRREGGDILWRSVTAEPPLFRLQAQLHAALEKEGFQLESRKFSPHLTLARQVIFPDNFIVPPFEEVLSRGDAIHLMKSERIAGKLTYTSVYQKRLP